MAQPLIQLSYFLNQKEIRRPSKTAERLFGGEGGIRTPDRLAPMPHFECGAFDHSATSPGAITGRLCPLGRGEF
jgi:hypothetical protein